MLERRIGEERLTAGSQTIKLPADGGVLSGESFFRYEEDFAMYSVVVLMALQGGVDVPDCGRRGWGGWGGWGYGGYCGGWGYGGWGYGGYYDGWCYGGNYYGGVAVAYAPAQPSPATIVVTLPANARLTVGDYVGRSSESERSFVTPPLTAGQLFSYTLKAEHNGKETSRTITVRAGEVTRVNLAPTGSTVAGR